MYIVSTIASTYANDKTNIILNGGWQWATDVASASIIEQVLNSSNDDVLPDTIFC